MSESQMPLTPSRPLPAGETGLVINPDSVTCHDADAQEREDWAATIALTVAATLEPSCAFAFCFGKHQFLHKLGLGKKSDMP